MKNSFGAWDTPDDEPPPADPEDAPEEPTLYFNTLDAFVRDVLAETYRRDLKTARNTWCAEWWRHTEAIARLEALWRAWEHLRLDPATGMSVWFRDHADHHMRILLDNDEGPFKGCTPAEHHQNKLQPLPHKAPPDGMF